MTAAEAPPTHAHGAAGAHAHDPGCFWCVEFAKLDLPTYTAAEVCARAGCNWRQLDYWCRTGLLPGPDHRRGGKFAGARGDGRRFALVEVVAAAAILGMLEEGISLRRVREAVARGERLRLVASPLGTAWPP